MHNLTLNQDRERCSHSLLAAMQWVAGTNQPTPHYKTVVAIRTIKSTLAIYTFAKIRERHKTASQALDISYRFLCCYEFVGGIFTFAINANASITLLNTDLLSQSGEAYIKACAGLSG